MQFDKKTLNSLLAQGDQALWNSIRAIAMASKIDLPAQMPPESEMRRLRGLLQNNTSFDVNAAMKTVEDYKRKQGKNE